ncbi:hypothetical protein [Streptomyces klenkii]|nr:hypothetical protein [Streptomyces klenkii]
MTAADLAIAAVVWLALVALICLFAGWSGRRRDEGDAAFREHIRRTYRR